MEGGEETRRHPRPILAGAFRTCPLQMSMPVPPPSSVQAAAAEDSTAMAHLAHMYASGTGVPQDNATAVDWFRKAADRGGLLAAGDGE